MFYKSEIQKTVQVLKASKGKSITSKLLKIELNGAKLSLAHTNELSAAFTFNGFGEELVHEKLIYIDTAQL